MMVLDQQIEQLYRLCHWSDQEQFAHGKLLAESLLGERWKSVQIECVTGLPVHKRSAIQSLRLYYEFVEKLYAYERFDRSETCLSLGLALTPNPLVTYHFLTGWTRNQIYHSPEYDFAWQIVNLGLFWAHQQADKVLFYHLLNGVEFGEGRFSVDQQLSPLPVRAGYSILLQHQIRGLVALAPESCDRARVLRQAVDVLEIDAQFDSYKWERDFPVDLLPVSLFENLTTLTVSSAAPLLNVDSLDRCPQLQSRSFEHCYKPWSKDTTWGVEELQRTLNGEPIGYQFGDTPYIDLSTGQKLVIRQYGSSALPPPAYSFEFPLDSAKANFARQILSDDSHQRSQARDWATAHELEARQVVQLDGVSESQPNYPTAVCLPNVRITPNNPSMNAELLHTAFLLYPDQCREVESLHLYGGQVVDSLEYLAELPALRRLQISGCNQLSSLSGVYGLYQLESLELRQAKRLKSIAEITNCSKLKSLKLTEVVRLSEYKALGELLALTELSLSGVQHETLQFLPDNLNLETLHFNDMPNLTSIEGFESIGMPKYSKLRRVELQNNIALTDLVGIGANEGVSNLQINLIGCSALTSVSGLEGVQDVQKVTLYLDRCSALLDLSALSAVHGLKKLHLHMRNGEQLQRLRATLKLSPQTRLVINQKPAAMID